MRPGTRKYEGVKKNAACVSDYSFIALLEGRIVTESVATGSAV